MVFRSKSHSLLSLNRWMLTSLLIVFSVGQLPGQDADPTDAPNQKKSDAAETDKDVNNEDPDPFAVPEGADARALLRFIQTVKRQSGRKLEDVKRAASAAADAAQAMRELDELETNLEIRAIKEQIGALTFLSRYVPERKEQLKSLIDELQKDDREEIARIGQIESFKAEISAARAAGPDAQLKLVGKYKTMFDDRDFDANAYSLGSMLARSVEDPDSPETAADLYEYLGTKMAQSDDEKLQQRALKMLGAARRVRLPGNFMELAGTTTEGKEFDWDSYRGNVVLVDFWASWCGPCRREVPNMKRNLESYGERGFSIVGINLDKTREACDEYVEQEELNWENLLSDKKDEMGWDNPVASYYGISAIPTAILVDKEGKVVSLRARGRELDRLLLEMLGEPETPDAGDDDTETESDNS